MEVRAAALGLRPRRTALASSHSAQQTADDDEPMDGEPLLEIEQLAATRRVPDLDAWTDKTMLAQEEHAFFASAAPHPNFSFDVQARGIWSPLAPKPDPPTFPALFHFTSPASSTSAINQQPTLNDHILTMPLTMPYFTPPRPAASPDLADAFRGLFNAISLENPRLSEAGKESINLHLEQLMSMLQIRTLDLMAPSQHTSTFPPARSSELNGSGVAGPSRTAHDASSSINGHLNQVSSPTSSLANGTPTGARYPFPTSHS